MHLELLRSRINYSLILYSNKSNNSIDDLIIKLTGPRFISEQGIEISELQDSTAVLRMATPNLYLLSTKILCPLADSAPKLLGITGFPLAFISFGS